MMKVSVENIPRWRLKAQSTFEALMVNERNISMAARWCGGEVIDTNNLEPTYIRVPSLDEPFRVKQGQYLVKNMATGRFEVWDRDIWESQYEEIHKNGVTFRDVA